MARALGLFLTAVLVMAPAAHAADSVLVVGDSLEVGTGPHLRRELPGVRVTVDARIGRPSGEGVQVLRDRLLPKYGVVVFDIGVNDSPAQPGVLAGDLAAVRGLAGERCLVVATMQRPPLNGVSVAGLNRAVEDFANTDPRVQVVDWHGAVAREPGLLTPDGVHPTPGGYALRGRLVAGGVHACLGGGAPEPKASPAPPPVDVGDAPRRPLLVSWAALSRRAPVSGVLAVFTGGAHAIAGAQAQASAAALPAAPEPVLGGR